MTVADVMTAYPETLSPTDSIQKAAQLMRDHGYGIVPILDGVDALVGVVTDRDIVTVSVAHGHGPETPVEDCMTRQPDSIAKDSPIADALHLMNTRQIRRLPVVENGRLIGMLSLSDVARSEVPETEKAKVLESVSASGADLRPGADLPEA